MNEGPAGARERLVYGRRKGKKLRPGRQSLYDEALPRLRLALPEAGHLDLPALFGDPKSAYWIEIGFGAGEHLADQAALHPDVGFIGCEPFLNGLAACVSHVTERGLGNVRLHGDDARQVLKALPPASLARAHVLFPDPWPKLRHNRRRIVSTPVLDMLSGVLADGAELRLATDHMDYARWMLRHCLAHPDFVWLAERPDDWRRPAPDETPTRYEQKALSAGLKPLYFRFRRRPRE